MLTRFEHQMLLTSPRNSIPAHVNLFNLLDCTVLLAPNPQPPMVSALTAAHKLHVAEVPDLHELLTKRHPHYPYTKTFDGASHEPLLAFHTSGSTGLPKPIVWSHAFAAAYVKMTQLDPPSGFESQDRLFQANRLLFMLPPFHAANHCTSLCNAINNRTTIVYPLAAAIPTAQVMLDALKHTTADVALVPPTIIADIGKDKATLDFVAEKLETLLYAGGDVPQVLGHPVASRMQLVNIYGASEMGVPPSIRPEGVWPHEDWKYVNIHPDTGVRFEHCSDDLYELCIVRNPKFESWQPVFKLYPNLQTFPSGDLFSAHPSKPGLWKHQGRADDIIVFLTGEKTNPTSMEERINSIPEVRAALVAGAQRFQAALLIELTAEKVLSAAERAETLERIWPTIQEANKDCPAHAMIDKSHILFVDPNKPIMRAGKGTVQRRPTLSLYAEELEALYADAERIAISPATDIKQAIDVHDREKTSSFIRETITRRTGWNRYENEDNLFLLGMDSLQALLITRDLRQGFANLEIAVSTVYTNPTVFSLANAMSELSALSRQSQIFYQQTRRQAIEATFQEHKNSIDNLVSNLQTKTTKSSATRTAENKKHTVILTGSSGALGSYLLEVLLNTPSASHVYCLDRASGSSSIRSQRNKTRKLASDYPSDRVTFLTADISQQEFGLERETYEALLTQATAVIHSAWPVNFNLPLSAFGPQLVGITRLAEFAVSAAHSPVVFFVSSISSVLDYHGSSPSIREEIISDTKAPSSMGYGESKYLAELLLDYASKRLSIDAGIARVGQIAGPVNVQGIWNEWEWLPSLVLSSLHVGAVPDSLGASQTKIDWVPIDLLAEVLVELTLNIARQEAPTPIQAEETGKARVFHPLNPHPVTWKSLLPSIVNTLSHSNARTEKIDTVPFQAWLDKVRTDAETAGSADVETMLKSNPAAKLLGFYEKLAEDGKTLEFETSKTEDASSKMRAIGEIKPEWIERWVGAWLAIREERAPEII